MGLDYFPMSLLTPCRASSRSSKNPCAICTTPTPNFPNCSPSVPGSAATATATPSYRRLHSRTRQQARQAVVDHYIAETTRLIGYLSMSTRRIGVSEALSQRIRKYDKVLGEKYSRWKQITAAEVYRAFLEFLIARLRFTRKSVEARTRLQIFATI